VVVQYRLEEEAAEGVLLVEVFQSLQMVVL
jgi:hypothetical protein